VKGGGPGRWGAFGVTMQRVKGPQGSTITPAQAQAILDAALPFKDRQADFANGKRCEDPELLAYQDTHPLAVLSDMTCAFFAWAPNDVDPTARGFVDPLARQAWIGGVMRSPRFANRTPGAVLDSTLRDAWSAARPSIYKDLGRPRTCQAPGCDAPINRKPGDYDIDHIEPQHADMVADVVELLGGPAAVADWWGYRWRPGVNNRLRDHLLTHPAAPLTVFGLMIAAAHYQALCKACHKAATKARKDAAKAAKAGGDA
jgi:hypothetical protein